MKVDKNIAKLISELEYIIGSQCYNPNSYDGYTGEEGAEFRYPVNIYRNNSIQKYRYQVNSLTTEEVDTMRYHFGANHLYIGQGLVQVLEYIEQRYNISFNELENDIQ